MSTLRILVADHVVVGVEHLVSPNISNVGVGPGLVQAAPHVEQRVRVPQTTEFNEFGDVETNTCGRSRVLSVRMYSSSQRFPYCPSTTGKLMNRPSTLFPGRQSTQKDRIIRATHEVPV